LAVVPTSAYPAAPSWEDHAVDRFRILDNIRHFRHRLSSELDSTQRAQLQKQLVEEEDKLGAHVALLDDVEREIKKAIVLIARQRALIAAMERHGRDGIQQARTLLNCLIDDQNWHQHYHQNILIAIEKARSDLS
jgi:hypothetical protein